MNATRAEDELTLNGSLVNLRRPEVGAVVARLDDIGVNQEVAGAGALGSLALGSPVVLPEPVSSLATLGFGAGMAYILGGQPAGILGGQPAGPAARAFGNLLLHAQAAGGPGPGRGGLGGDRQLGQGGLRAADGERLAGGRGCCATLARPERCWNAKARR